jgi:hypothetical protein
MALPLPELIREGEKPLSLHGSASKLIHHKGMSELNKGINHQERTDETGRNWLQPRGL